ncbi:MAG: transcription antitermination factor NusB [Pseudomonadota bacterium]|nr:transcription antitermination factor NusB [Pseudomonadota bacterium]
MVKNKKAESKSLGVRGLARLMLVQALYQMQMTDHSNSEILSQFKERKEYQKIDKEYFNQALQIIYDGQKDFISGIEVYLDRSLNQIDPVEMGILLVGYYELKMRPEIDIPVVIDEAVNLAKCFGAVEGHKYINAILDRASKELRSS